MEKYDLQLNKFVGQWITEGLMPAADGQAETIITGTDTYEWILDGNFLLHKADVMMGGTKSLTHEIISADSQSNGYRMQHFNNQGQQGIMTATHKNDIWTFLGNELRFTGGFSQNDSVFSGNWEILDGNDHWTHLMKITLRK